MKVLLIGGTGVLSSAIMELSIERGHKTYVLNRGNRANLIHPDAIFLKANIRNKKEIECIIKGLYFDIVIDFISYNVSDLKCVLSVFQYKCKQFFFISSCAVYRKPEQNGVFTEQSVLIDPEWDYSINKVKCEKYLEDKCKKAELQYTIIRPAITYGNTRIPYSITPAYGWHWTLIARMLNNKPILIWNEGKGITTITHVSDFAKGVIGLFGNPKAYNEAFHITTDNYYSWREVAETIGEIIGQQPVFADLPKDFIIEQRPYMRGIMLGSRAKNTIFDNSKIKAAVPDFSCNINLKEGIAKTIEHYKTHNYLYGIDYYWDGQMDNLLFKYYKKLNQTKKGHISELNTNFKSYLPNTYFTDRIAYILGRTNCSFIFRIYNRLISYYKNKKQKFHNLIKL